MSLPQSNAPEYKKSPNKKFLKNKIQNLKERVGKTKILEEKLSQNRAFTNAAAHLRRRRYAELCSHFSFSFHRRFRQQELKNGKLATNPNCNWVEVYHLFTTARSTEQGSSLRFENRRGGGRTVTPFFCGGRTISVLAEDSLVFLRSIGNVCMSIVRVRLQCCKSGRKD